MQQFIKKKLTRGNFRAIYIYFRVFGSNLFDFTALSLNNTLKTQHYIKCY